MKFVIALALVAVAAARPGDHYDSKFENLNVKEIIDNERLFHAYIDCFTGIGRCTPEGKELNGLIPDGVQSSCSKCTEPQKPMIATFIAAIKEKAADKWNILNEKYNPGGKYDEVLENFLKEYKH